MTDLWRHVPSVFADVVIDSIVTNSIVDEFKLRRHARLHFIPPDDRDDDLNPIVRNEFEVMDRESLPAHHQRRINERLRSACAIRPDLRLRFDQPESAAHREILSSTPARVEYEPWFGP